MTYYTLQPSQKLSPFVKCFWVLEDNRANENPYIHRTLANGFPELIFHYRGIFDEIFPGGIERSFTSGIHGQTQKFRRFIIKENFGIFGVYLYPSAIPQFFSSPATELTDEMPDLEALLGQEGKFLEEKMMTARDNVQRVKIISAFLGEKISENYLYQPDVFSCINHIIQSKGVANIKTLAGKHFLSVRQFERKFKQFSGFPPKLFSRIIRFQAAIKKYDNKKLPLTEIAYECGYYDQSHFIHDFKEFSGYHPMKYFSGKAEGTEYKDV